MSVSGDTATALAIALVWALLWLTPWYRSRALAAYRRREP